MPIVRKKHGSYSRNVNRKIVQVNDRLGNKGVSKDQGTSRTIYDAVQLATTTTNTQLILFENAKTRQFPLTNLQENKLQVGETIAMQRFSFYVIECTSATTNALGIMPLYFFAQFQRLYAATFDFYIGQDWVIKKKPLADMYAPFNKDSKFMGMTTSQAGYTVPAAAATYDVPIVLAQGLPHDVQWFDNDLIIPQQVEFKAIINVPPISLPSGFDFYFAMKLEGLGSLYSPKSNF